jgi:small conductance mechanosensitive channel
VAVGHIPVKHNDSIKIKYYYMCSLLLFQFSFENAMGKLFEKLQGWLDALILKLPNLVLAVIVIVVFWYLAKVTSRLVRKYLLRKSAQESIKGITSKFIFAAVFLIGFFLALGILELDQLLTSILAGAGVVGLVIGLALQATLGHSVSGVMLSFLPRIRIGDYVDTNGHSGFIAEINLRNILIRRPDNNYVIIPNSKIADEPFVNYSITERSRIELGCGVGYESDLEKVEALVRKVVAEHFVPKDDEDVEFFYTEFGDSSINFVVRFWITFQKRKHELEARHQAVKLIKAAFNENDINIPFPIRTLDFGKNTLEVKKSEVE